MVYLIGPDGPVNRRFANFHKMVWMTTVHVIRIHAVFLKFAYPQFTGYAEYIRFSHREHLNDNDNDNDLFIKYTHMVIYNYLHQFSSLCWWEWQMWCNMKQGGSKHTSYKIIYPLTGPIALPRTQVVLYEDTVTVFDISCKKNNISADFWSIKKSLPQVILFVSHIQGYIKQDVNRMTLEQNVIWAITRNTHKRENYTKGGKASITNQKVTPKGQ